MEIVWLLNELEDIGGQDRLRGLWKHYYHGSHGIIFVIDSSDKGRIELAREELYKLMDQDELRNAAVLVLANKQDLPDAMTSSELTSKLDLYALRNRDWYIQSTCATTGQGVYEGLDWLTSTLRARR